MVKHKGDGVQEIRLSEPESIDEPPDGAQLDSIRALFREHLCKAEEALAVQHRQALRAFETIVGSNQKPRGAYKPRLSKESLVFPGVTASKQAAWDVDDNSPKKRVSVSEKPALRSAATAQGAPKTSPKPPKDIDISDLGCDSQPVVELNLNRPFTPTEGAPELFGEPQRVKSWEGSVASVVSSNFAGINDETRKTMRHQQAAAKQAQKTLPDPKAQQNGQPKAVFADASAMKDKVRAAIMKPDFNIADFYHTTGIAQRIARMRFFENFTLLIIGLNALWIAIDTDKNPATTLFRAHWVFQVGENLFCVYFAFEVTVRFMAFKWKRDCVRDGWFIFDSALVIMMILETWLVGSVVYFMNIDSEVMADASIFRLLRMLRLTRMARMVRLLRAFPELLILVKGIAVAARSVFFTLVLLAIIIYLFAIAFVQLTEDTPDISQQYFPTVPDAMVTLLLHGALPDMADFVIDVSTSSIFNAFFALFFILLSSLTVLNMLVGVLCEVVSVVSSVEKEQMTVRFVKSKLLELIREGGIDEDQNGMISKPEFEELLTHPEAARILQEVGVDVVGLVDFADFIFHDEGVELSFPDFMELVLQLRSSNTATVKDIVDLRKFIVHVTQEQEEGLKESVHEVKEILDDRLQSTVQRAVSIALLNVTDQEDCASRDIV
eukprot:TRINITY_DN2441_c0_g1_i1.p1 TRINITY_DN2441_c0_g1~~TRINITY_DN2441_c0_g1_i1.p1  ORF type:complete len:665 (-),score=164.75 TRINITY_DN2441_c0_g1_i1:38-2032(-)